MNHRDAQTAEELRKPKEITEAAVTEAASAAAEIVGNHKESISSPFLMPFYDLHKKMGSK
jgi:hypothetical protein